MVQTCACHTRYAVARRLQRLVRPRTGPRPHPVPPHVRWPRRARPGGEPGADGPGCSWGVGWPGLGVGSSLAWGGRGASWSWGCAVLAIFCLGRSLSSAFLCLGMCGLGPFVFGISSRPQGLTLAVSRCRKRERSGRCRQSAPLLCSALTLLPTGHSTTWEEGRA